MTKIIVEPGHEDIKTLDSELTEKAAKIIMTKDMIEKECKYCFLIVVLVVDKTKYGIVIGNPVVQWTTPEDPKENWK